MRDIPAYSSAEGEERLLTDQESAFPPASVKDLMTSISRCQVIPLRMPKIALGIFVYYISSTALDEESDIPQFGRVVGNRMVTDEVRPCCSLSHG